MKLRYIGEYRGISADPVGQLSSSSVSGLVGVSTEPNAHENTFRWDLVDADKDI